MRPTIPNAAVALAAAGFSPDDAYLPEGVMVDNAAEWHVHANYADGRFFTIGLELKPSGVVQIGVVGGPVDMDLPLDLSGADAPDELRALLGKMFGGDVRWGCDAFLFGVDDE